MRSITWCLAAAVMSPAAVMAAPAAAPAEKARIQDYLAFASKLFRAKDYEGALLQLRRAEPMLKGHPKRPLVIYNMARCLEELGRYAEALATYERFLDAPDTDSRQAQAQAKIARLIPLATGYLTVQCQPSGVQLLIEGLGTQRCPWRSTRLKAGSYRIEANKAGYARQFEQLEVVAGRTTEISMVLPALQVGEVDAVGPASRTSTRAWVAVATGVALLGTGVALHLSAKGARDEANGEVAGADFDALKSSYRQREIGAYSAYALGGTALALGAWWMSGDTP